MSLDAARIQWHISEQYPRMAYLTGKLLPNLSAGGLGCGGIKGPLATILVKGYQRSNSLLGGMRFSVPQTWLSQTCFADIICSLDQPALSSALRKMDWRSKSQGLRQSEIRSKQRANINSPARSQHRTDGHAERRSPGLVDQWRCPAVRPPRLSGCPSQMPWFCGTLQDGVGRWGEFQSGWVSHEQLGCSGNQIGILMGMYTFFSNAKLPWNNHGNITIWTYRKIEVNHGKSRYSDYVPPI